MILYSPSIQRYVKIEDMPYNDLKNLIDANYPAIGIPPASFSEGYMYRNALRVELSTRRVK